MLFGERPGRGTSCRFGGETGALESGVPQLRSRWGSVFVVYCRLRLKKEPGTWCSSKAGSLC